MQLNLSKIMRYAHLMGLRGGTLVVKFALTVFLARFAGLDVLGAYGLVVGLTLALPVVVRAGLLNTLIRDLVDAEPYKIATDLKHYGVWCAGVYVAMLPVAVAMDVWPVWPDMQGLAVLIWAIVALEHVAVDVVVMLNNMRKPQVANMFGLLQAVVWSVPFMVASFWWPHLCTVEALLVFWVGGTVVALAGVWPWFSNLPWASTGKVSEAWYCRNLKGSFMLWLHDGTSTVGQFADRYLVAGLLNLEMTGVYTLFLQIANALFTLVNASILQVHRPQLLVLYRKASTQAEAAQFLRSIQRESLGVLAILSVMAGGMLAWCAPWLGKPLVVQYIPLLGAVLLASWLRIASWTYLMALMALKKDKMLLVSNAIGVIVALAASWMLINATGSYAMAWGACMGCTLTCVLGYYGIRRA